MSSEEPQPRAVFGQILEDYLAQLRQAWEGIDFALLGVRREADTALIPYFGQLNRVSLTEGFTDPGGQQPSHATCVALAKYLLHNGRGSATGNEWVAYKQFPDAAPYAEGYSNTVERRIAKSFAGNGSVLATECTRLGGQDHGAGLSYDLAVRFEALPRVPLLLLFNDEEAPFPAQCSVLLQEDAPRYLDMECLAILGLTLAQRLIAALKGPSDHKLVG